MTTEELEAITPGNPFHSDYWRMGTYLGKNTCVMYEKHPHEHQPYLIIVDMTSGERVRVNLQPEAGE